jgi:hypothetical protein
MAKTTKQAKRTPVRRADVTDDTWAKRTGMLLYLRELQTAEELARDFGRDGIAERRLDLARDDPNFQSFLDQVRGGRRASLPR